MVKGPGPRGRGGCHEASQTQCNNRSGIHACMYARMHVCAYMYTCVRVHIYMHICACMYILRKMDGRVRCASMHACPLSSEVEKLAGEGRY